MAQHRQRDPAAITWQATLLIATPADSLLQAHAVAHVPLLAREWNRVERAQAALGDANERFDALGEVTAKAHDLNTLTLSTLHMSHIRGNCGALALFVCHSLQGKISGQHALA